MEGDVLQRMMEAGDASQAKGRPASGLAEKIAIVTGASSGIGRAIAIALGAAGATVCAVGRNPQRLAEAETSIRAAGARAALGIRAELNDEGDLQHLTRTIGARFGRADILVHSAGSWSRGALDSASIESLDALYRDNLRGPYRLMQTMLPLLKEAQGDIVLIGSTQGLNASAGVGQYAATHHALTAVANSLRDEVNAQGVRVTMLHAGSTATPRQERIFAETGRAYAPERLLQPQDVAAVVLAALSLPRTAEITTLTIRPMQKP